MHPSPGTADGARQTFCPPAPGVIAVCSGYFRVAAGRGAPHAPLHYATRRRRLVTVVASDDDEIVPIISGRVKKGFTPKEYEQLRKPQQLGGETIGEELGAAVWRG